MRPGRPTQGLMRAGPRVIRCALGKGGIVSRKREGDGGTPLATMMLSLLRVRRNRRFAVATRLATRPIRSNDGWCDAPEDPNYNRPVRLPYGASHERMMRDDALYDFCVVLDWNLRPRRRGCGSAIFMHLARPGHRPTEGCIALSRADMRWLLAHVPNTAKVTVLR